MPVYENYVFFALALIAILAVITVSVCVLQVYCKKYCGINFCPGAGAVMSRSTRLNRVRLAEQEQAAIRLQQQLNAEYRKEQQEERRKERRAKYTSLLKYHMMTVTENDLVHDRMRSEEADIESGEDARDTNIVALGSDGDNHLLLKVPGKNGKVRFAAGHCAICLGAYSPGDVAIRSTSSRCPHVFHEECIFMWLSKGKKRCPVCRNLFAPSILAKQNSGLSLEDDEESEPSTVRVGQNDDPDSMSSVPNASGGDIDVIESQTESPILGSSVPVDVVVSSS